MPYAVQDLIRELLPSPQRCLEEIHALLPQLAAQRYQELVEEVSHCVEKIRALSAAKTTKPLQMPCLAARSLTSYSMSC